MGINTVAHTLPYKLKHGTTVLIPSHTLKHGTTFWHTQYVRINLGKTCNEHCDGYMDFPVPNDATRN